MLLKNKSMQKYKPTGAKINGQQMVFYKWMHFGGFIL